MYHYIALLRGINVGGKNSLPMKELVSIFQGLGYDNVRSYIQSGNIVFDSSKKLGGKEAGVIARRILSEKGFEPKVLLLTSNELQDVITQNPFDTEIGKALHFFFLDSLPKKPNLERLRSLKIDTEQFALIKKVFYLYAPNGVGKSKLAAGIESAIGVPVTARNCNTVCKLVEMVEKK